MAKHPDQHGSASIKAILPMLTGRTYANLAIQEGDTASREFVRVRRGLEAFCGQDTVGDGVDRGGTTRTRWRGPPLTVTPTTGQTPQRPQRHDMRELSSTEQFASVLGECDHREVDGLLPNHLRQVTFAFGVFQQNIASRPEAALLPVGYLDLHFTRQHNVDLTPRGRVPIRHSAHRSREHHQTGHGLTLQLTELSEAGLR